MYYVLRNSLTDNIMLIDNVNKKPYTIPLFLYKDGFFGNIKQDDRYIKVYDTTERKIVLLNLVDFTDKTTKGKVFGYKDGQRYNDYIDEIFEYGCFKYYIYHNIVLVYNKNTNKLRLYEINEEKYCELSFSRGIITLYRMYDTKLEKIVVTKENLVKKMNVELEDFNVTYKAIVLKYMLGK